MNAKRVNQRRNPYPVYRYTSVLPLNGGGCFKKVVKRFSCLTLSAGGAFSDHFSFCIDRRARLFGHIIPASPEKEVNILVFIFKIIKSVIFTLVPLAGCLVTIHFACENGKSVEPVPILRCGVDVTCRLCRMLWASFTGVLPVPVAAIITGFVMVFITPWLVVYYGLATLTSFLSHPLRYVRSATKWLAARFS